MSLLLLYLELAVSTKETDGIAQLWPKMTQKSFYRASSAGSYGLWPTEAVLSLSANSHPPSSLSSYNFHTYGPVVCVICYIVSTLAEWFRGTSLRMLPPRIFF